MQLQDLGWNDFFAEAFRPYAEDDLVPARVVARHHGPCELVCEGGPLGGIPSGRLPEDGLPAVGDWVVARPLPGERKAIVEAVLPRRTAFVRKEAWRRTVEQVVAANLDTVFVITAFGRDLSARRLERYLTAAWDSGAEPAIVVNKLDLAAEPDVELVAIEPAVTGVPVLTISAVTGAGLEALEPYLGRGRTVALLGSSGVGKSTLVNRLCGRELAATGPVSADGRGRHTTTNRELVALPGGGLLLDTPGLRELQLWADEDALDRSFADVADLATGCRFADCSHEHEPGCAVRAALVAGTLDPDRFAGYRKLQRELRALEVRRDARLRSDARKEWRRFERSRRRSSY